MNDEIKRNLSEMLFNRNERLLDYITNLQQENKRLTNNWNELEKYAQDLLENGTWSKCGAHKILDKMKEIKEGK